MRYDDRDCSGYPVIGPVSMPGAEISSYKPVTDPANFLELRLNEAARAADAAREVTERWLPGG